MLCFQDYHLCIWIFSPHDMEDTPSTIPYYRYKLNLYNAEERNCNCYFISLNFNDIISAVTIFPPQFWSSSRQNCTCFFDRFFNISKYFVIRYLTKWNKINKKKSKNLFWKTKLEEWLEDRIQTSRINSFSMKMRTLYKNVHLNVIHNKFSVPCLKCHIFNRI